MSAMEIFYGSFKPSELAIEPEDTDEFTEIEKQHGCLFVKANGQLYEVREIKKLDAYGFSMVIPPSDETMVICYWYNGGAEIHEVIEDLITAHESTQ